MEASTDHATEIERLQRCVSDLVSVLALPAVWSGSEPSRILETFLDALHVMLDLDFLYARVRPDPDEAPFDALKTSALLGESLGHEEIRDALANWSEDDPERSIRVLEQVGVHGLSFFPLRMGVNGELGLIVAGSMRAGFPERTERLILSVAANQATIGLQQALRLNEQKRVAGELDRRVAERTRELAEINEQLQLQAGILQHLPVSAWTLKPDGTPDFVNQVWLDFSGQTLEFVRSHPEAWIAAVHPDDREAVSRAFLDGVRSGDGFAIETRSLRAQDGTYRWHLQQAVVLRDVEGKVLKFVGTTTDIDDQKRAQEALRMSEAGLARVIDTIPTLSWSMFPDGPNEFLSKRWHDYTGLSVEESGGWGWQIAFHPDDMPSLMDTWTRILSSGEPGEVEARIRRFDGVYRWFLIRAAPFRDETGTIIRWYGTSTDIEDRKRAEAAVLASERNLSLIINTMPVLAWSAQTDGTVDFFNQRWLDYTGLSPEEAHGWGWAQAFHPDDLSGLTEYWQSIIIAGEPGEIEARLRRFDGSYRWFLFRANPLRDASGAVVKWYGTNTDIDDRKRAEEEIRLRELNLRQITETIPEMLWSAGPDGMIDYCNGRLLKYGGLSSEAVMGNGWTKMLHPDDVDSWIQSWKSSVETGRPYRVEVRTFHAADRTYRWCVTSALPLHDEHGNILKWHGTVVDMHDWKQAQEDLRNAQAEIAKMTKITTMGELTASIAHEVNQPLSGIMTNANTCLRILDASTPNIEGARETARRIIRDGTRASDVVTHLRRLFSMKEVLAANVDLNEATREVIALMASDLQKDNIILTHNYADNLPSIKGDRVQLQQVILNLARNASDAMASVNERPRHLVFRTEKDGNHVRLTVQDTGVGFDPTIRDRLFESFYTTKPDGMGMGLSVCRSIIEAHRGRLWAKPNEDYGATFAFSIPWRDDD